MEEGFDLLMAETPMELEVDPVDLSPLATFAINYFKDAIVEERLNRLVLLTARGREVTEWMFEGKPPASMDEVVRSVGARTGCDSLAFVFPTAVPPEVRADRVVNLALEGYGMSVDILFAMMGRWGDPEAKVQLHQRVLGSTMRWLGVPTTVTFELWVKGGPRWGTPEGEA